MMRLTTIMKAVDKALGEIGAEERYNKRYFKEEVGPFAVLCLVEYGADPGFCPIVWEGRVDPPVPFRKPIKEGEE